MLSVTKCWFLVLLWDGVGMERIVFFFPFLLFGSNCFQHCSWHIGNEYYTFVLGSRCTSETFWLILWWVTLCFLLFLFFIFFPLWSTFSIVWSSNRTLELYHKFHQWTWRVSNEKFVWCHNLRLWWLMPQQRRWMILVIMSK